MSKPLTYDWNGHTDMPVSYPHLTDFQMAGKVRMLMRTDLDHEGVVCGARDRIMGLSKLADKQRALIENMVAAFRDLSELTESGDDPISYVREIANEALAAAKSEGFDQ